MKHPAVRWTIACLLMLALFWLPIVNGVASGALAAWSPRDRAKTITYALWSAAVLAIPLWWLSVHGAVWNPLESLGGLWRAVLSLLAFIGTATLVSTLRTPRPAV